MIAAGWILSWWGPPRIRSILLSVSAVVAVLCLAVGNLTKGEPVSPEDASCSPAFTCMYWHPIYWVEAGLIDFGCCLALLVVTVLVDTVVRLGRRAFAGSPR
ncbi:hypothetical protein ACGFZS_11770 [Streptomyces sp. NPDC048288]|uniref:hypothetical protein n=1 Tax=Streptomyces sp. NPDC048288 TaxID=3365529 RepID=UPI00371FDF9C